ncbi:unnamed protein product [Darwinula stevensoni]|uniref:Uncharacterized protein n=1 Tax=Darwinula stevensoni TaxID=69355 RepID=A0A7R9FQT7_9CRUS|nr:unnamed protein product [Darwinula stevensoni]CAG0900037.1 unnamed protein product [Darwinula stevensoni]
MVIFRDYYGRLLTFPQIKVLVLIGYLGYLAVAIYGVTQLREGAVGEDKLTIDISTTGKYWQLNDRYFRKFSFGVDVMITETLDYSRNETQWKVEELLKKMESLPHIAESSYTNNWLRNFLSFIYTTGEFVDYDISDEEKFINTLKDTFLLDGTYGNEVIFNKAGTKIIATKYHLRTKDMQSVKEELMVMLDLRAIADASGLNVTVHSGPFKFFDQLVMVWPMTVTAVTAATVSMLIVSFLLIPDTICAIWVGLSIASIEAGVVGFMALAGLELDNVTAINIIMSIGFSVDFSAHITYAYVSSRGLPPNERLRESLHKLGVPILQSSLSTIVSLIPLTFIPSFILMAFFTLNFLVMSLGTIHGILILPVLLSVVGPGACSKKKQEDADEEKVSYPGKDHELSWKDCEVVVRKAGIMVHRRCKSLDASVLSGGVAKNGFINEAFPGLRKEAWNFLLGMYPYDSTEEEREEFRKTKVDDFYRMELQRRSISAEQESCCSAL